MRGVFFFLFIAAAFAQRPGLELRGRVTDENDAPVADARVSIRPAGGTSPEALEAITDPTGSFGLTLPAAGDYLVNVERRGYYALAGRPVRVEGATEITLAINTVREVFQSLDVNERPSPVDIAQVRHEESLTGTEVNDIPYSSSHGLRNALEMLPGAILTPDGSLHFNGSSENQVEYTLNGFNISNPITRQFQTTLSVEGIRSVDYASGRYPPENGKGTAGVTSIQTQNGTDTLRYTVTDFVPGVDFHQGVRLGNWYPRAGISGPIVRDRAWYSDTLQSEYNTTLVTGLPENENTRSAWVGSNLLHTQINPTQGNIVYTDFLVNIDNEARVGLGPLDPVSTTRTVRRRQYFGSARDHLTIGGRALVEFGYAHDFNSTAQTPQGSELFVFSPEGRTGNYFVNSTQTASRDQALAHLYAPQFRYLGSHQPEAGLDIEWVRYDASFQRTGYQLIGLSGKILASTSFTGAGVFRVTDRIGGYWIADAWRISSILQVNAGLRRDQDQVTGNGGWSPRISASWKPFHAEHARVAGGYSVTHDAVPLEPFGREFDQAAITTGFDASGEPSGPPAITSFAPPGRLKLPRATNWSAGVDYETAAHFHASVAYLRRRGTDGFSFLNITGPDEPPSLLPLPNGVSPGLFQLANLRRDDYDSMQIAVTKPLSGQHEWMVSYTRSRARSNAVMDANVTVPFQVLPGMVPLPWDAPNRLLGRAYVPLPWRDWSFAALADARSGFPFSVQQETGEVAGAVSSYRYPFNFDLNLALERFITLRGFRFALRAGVNNLTNAKNPTAVNNVTGSPQYLQFFGEEGRHYVLRLRFFGRAGSK